ncbi:MAG: hypothetical protein R3C49_22025 [Planctomycetaceae bacterium]
MYDKIVLAGAEALSFRNAARLLERLAEVKFSSRQINRIVHETGEQLHAEQAERAEQFFSGKLACEVENVPDLAVVECDGGRIRTRQPDSGPGTHDPAWRESKVGLCMRMTSEVHEHDPAPEPPESLQNRHYVSKLAKEVAGAVIPESESDPGEAEAISDNEPDADDVHAVDEYKSPKRLMRTVLASVDDIKTFGRKLAAEVHRKGLNQAPRKAFVGDGMPCNWTLQKTFFPLFVAIVDFIHVISYLYKASVAIGESEDFGWGLCADWIRACWQGRVTDVIRELQEWLDAQPARPDDISNDDPREIVRVSIGYLKNNASRMDYPSYRCQGLPLTSTLVESLIKEINYRVKGTEKFWNDPEGANRILAVKAASLSDDSRLVPGW